MTLWCVGREWSSIIDFLFPCTVFCHFNYMDRFAFSCGFCILGTFLLSGYFAHSILFVTCCFVFSDTFPNFSNFPILCIFGCMAFIFGRVLYFWMLSGFANLASHMRRTQARSFRLSLFKRFSSLEIHKLILSFKLLSLHN